MDSILDSLNNGDANLNTKLTPKTQFLITNNNNKVFTLQKNNDDNITLNQSVSIFNSDIISLNNNNNNQNNSLSDITINFSEEGVYRYICLVHPWTTGTISIVKPNSSIYDKMF